MHLLFQFLLFFLSLFMIVIVLLQKGRGGGLAGAFGGVGGHSAFGTKAAEGIVKVTIGLAAVWILTGLFALKLLSGGVASNVPEGLGGNAPSESDDSQSSTPSKDAGEGAGTDQDTGDSAGKGSTTDSSEASTDKPEEKDAPAGDSP